MGLSKKSYIFRIFLFKKIEDVQMICERQKIMNWIKHNQNNDKTSYEQQQEHYVTQDLATSLLEKTVTGHHYIQTLKELLNLHN